MNELNVRTHIRLNEAGEILQYPYSIANLRTDFPNISFGAISGDQDYSHLGVHPVYVSEQPTIDYTKNLVLGTPILSEGRWIEQWDVVEVSEEERERRVLLLIGNVNQHRMRLLSETDWTQLPDVQMSEEKKAAWTAYRQALRDVTKQPGFPFNVEWPAPPAPTLSTSVNINYNQF